MSIIISNNQRLFTLHTLSTTYQLQVDGLGFLRHLYYGPRVENADFSYLVQPRDRGFSGNPYDYNGDRRISADTLPLEYPCRGSGDYRESCIEAVHPDGSNALDLRYAGYKLISGKPDIPGLPSFRAEDTEADTLEVILHDEASGLQAVLQYCILEKADLITRRVRIENTGSETIQLLRVLSCCLDFMQPQPMDIISFYGRHAGERNMERSHLRHGKLVVDSTRGGSSLHQNPFVILCDQDSTEKSGSCYGMLFVYSGSFLAQAEVDQINQTRAVLGIHPQNFCWQLQPGTVFEAPEVALCYSDAGFSLLSNRLHAAIREHLIPQRFRNHRCPVLINNWEATYFDFDDEKLIHIAQEAKKLGVELFVLDDGWFGKRNNDTSSLGDWQVNTEKIRCGMAGLSQRIHNIGMQFGLWIEPEMISMNSDLYQAHPDWMLAIPGRQPITSRCQYVLDMSRKDVVDYLFSALQCLLAESRIDYIKWDMNRSICDIYSNVLPPRQQGEVLHRYMLGVYNLMDRLTQAFPELLLETCSGGGGRFDAGMLYFSPQIWCSDNTDPIERLAIQYGTSFAYPPSTMGSHVSASPNHQTGRTTPMKTRGIVAMAGTFGYELDPTNLSSSDKEEISRQIAFLKEHWQLLSHGTYYRLTGNPRQQDFCAWMNVDTDTGSAAVSWVCKNPTANAPVTYIKLCGLEKDALYNIPSFYLCLSGQALMTAGLPLPEIRGDYPSGIILLHKVTYEA